MQNYALFSYIMFYQVIVKNSFASDFAQSSPKKKLPISPSKQQDNKSEVNDDGLYLIKMYNFKHFCPNISFDFMNLKGILQFKFESFG